MRAVAVVRPRDRQRMRSTTPTDRRRAVGARVRAACALADLSLLDAAHAAGLNYRHLVAIANGHEPMTDTDARDLAATLGCPADWLARGWVD